MVEGGHTPKSSYRRQDFIVITKKFAREVSRKRVPKVKKENINGEFLVLFEEGYVLFRLGI